MMQSNIGSKVISGVFWRFGERICAQLVSFTVSIVLARMLSPDDYGIVAILLIFIDIANVFVVSSFGTALVQNKDADNLDYSSVFYFNIVFSLLVYLILFFVAPLISSFYKTPILTNLLRILAIKIPISGINSVQQAYVQKNMIFKKFFFSTIIGTVLSAVIGIILAQIGAGPYALVAQYLSNSFCDTVILWITVKWRPDMVFSINRLKPLLKFGWKILAASLLNTFYMNLRSLVIGKVYTKEDLAYYNQGRKMPQLIVTNLNATIDSVFLPAMATVQNDRERLKNMVRHSIRTSSMIMWPLMFGMLAASRNLVNVLLTDKWLHCIPFMWIACIQFGFEPIQTANLQAVKALGRSGIVLKLEIIKKGYGILVLFLTMRYGIMAIALGDLTQTFVALICNTFPNRILLKYSYKEQMKDLLPSILLAAIMGAVIFIINQLSLSKLVLIVLQVIVGVIIYGALLLVFQRSELYYFSDVFKSKFMKKK